MVWRWDQSDGKLYRDDVFVSTGYSGAGIGKNNPALQDRVAVGPIPQGLWEIVGPPYNSKLCGPFCLRLASRFGETYGRTAFLIHGDSAKRPGQASKGCIILPRNVRDLVWNSGDRMLVVAE